MNVHPLFHSTQTYSVFDDPAQHNPLDVPRVPGITGIRLARAKLAPRVRAQIAADILAGEVVLIQPTIRQVAALCGASVSAVAAVRADRGCPHRRRRGRAEIQSRILDEARSSRSPSQAAVAVLDHLDGATSGQLVESFVDLLRERDAEHARLVAGLLRELVELRERDL
jgi:hypothetical protein